MITQAFNYLLGIHKRAVTLARPGGASVSITVTPSNYFRNLAGVGEIVTEGKEYVLSKDVLDKSGFGDLKRGDRITDAETGLMTISEIRPMYGFGGGVIGYRLRSQ